MHKSVDALLALLRGRLREQTTPKTSIQHTNFLKYIVHKAKASVQSLKYHLQSPWVLSSRGFSGSRCRHAYKCILLLRRQQSKSTVPSNTVRFNVGGHRYEVSREIIERHPYSLPARIVDKVRYQEDEIFIDRDGCRFRYVLDWMRDGKVIVPLSETVEGVKQELDYYECYDVKEGSILSCVLAGDKQDGLIGDAHEVIDRISASIRYLQSLRAAIKATDVVLLRCKNRPDESRIEIVLTQREDKAAIEAALKAKAFFEERLAAYGLALVSYPMYILCFSDEPAKLEVKRVGPL